MSETKGIELREWFAGQALMGILSNSHYPPQGSGESADEFGVRVADSAYRIATAMIKEARRLNRESNAAW